MAFVGVPEKKMDEDIKSDSVYMLGLASQLIGADREGEARTEKQIIILLYHFFYHFLNFYWMSNQTSRL